MNVNEELLDVTWLQDVKIIWAVLVASALLASLAMAYTAQVAAWLNNYDGMRVECARSSKIQLLKKYSK